MTIQDADGCEGQTDLRITAANQILLDFAPIDPITLGDSQQLFVSSNIIPDSIIWNPIEDLSCTNCLDPVIRPRNQGIYLVTIFDENGCSASDQIDILVNKEERVFIPNSFSPNADGINDNFMVFGGPDVTRVTQFRIFNRWGALVFSISDFPPNDPLFGWDGTFDGEEVNPGVYVYVVEVEFFDGRTVMKTGDITVIR